METNNTHTPSSKRKCRNCAFAYVEQKTCGITKLPINPDSDYCTRHCANPMHCAICKSIVVNPIVEEIDGHFYTLCDNCSESLLYTCAVCANNVDKCNFITDPNPLPLYTIIQEHIGMNTFAQKRILNPERQKAICAQGCSCWNDSLKCCGKEYGFCEKYLLNKSLLPVIS